MSRPTPPPDCCSPKPALERRPLLSPEQATDLTAVFKVLANDNRLRILHSLVRAGELCVNDLAETVSMTPQAVSNQLQRLVDRGILGSRRAGTSIHYRIIERCVPALLDQGLCLTEDAESRHRVASPMVLGPPSPRATTNDVKA